MTHIQTPVGVLSNYVLSKLFVHNYGVIHNPLWISVIPRCGSFRSVRSPFLFVDLISNPTLTMLFPYTILSTRGRRPVSFLRSLPCWPVVYSEKFLLHYQDQPSLGLLGSLIFPIPPPTFSTVVCLSVTSSSRVPCKFPDKSFLLYDLWPLFPLSVSTCVNSRSRICRNYVKSIPWTK